MRHNAWCGAVAVAAAGLLISADCGLAQIRGVVLESETFEPVSGAVVALLDGELRQHGQAATDAEGRFRLDAPAGTYMLQASVAGRFGPVARGITTGTAAADSVVLVVPSELVSLAIGCAPGQGVVVAGVVHDEETLVPLPGARVTARWDWQTGEPPEATADAAGRYRFCAVPAEATLEFSVRALGRSSVSIVELPRLALVRVDLGVGLGIGGSTARVVATIALPDPASPGELSGRIVSSQDGAPIVDAVLRVAGHATTSSAGDDGLFRLTGLPTGDVVLEIEHLGYGVHREVVAVEQGVRTDLELVLSPRPIALAAIDVQGDAARLAARGSASRAAVFAGAQLRHAEERAARVPDLLRSLPGVTVMEGTFQTRQGISSGTCVTTNRRIGQLTPPPQARGGGYPWCDPIPLVLDGVLLGDAVEYLRALNLIDIESIQLVGAIEAQLLYGQRGGAEGGALVIWTRGRGPFAPLPATRLPENRWIQRLPSSNRFLRSKNRRPLTSSSA
jgi:hypothetical protein